jgi:DNA-binding transcriptional LysR family regulator
VDLCKLKTFRTVGVFLNFNKAAKVLNCAQSTISSQIKSLEEEIGALLFKRIKKKVVLTEAGEKMLFYANKLLSLEQEALADISSEMNPSGTIRLMVPESIAANYFPQLMQAFLSAYPSINFDISNCSQSGLEIELRSESVDLAFLFSESADFLNLNSEVLFREKLVVVSNPENSLATKKMSTQRTFTLKRYSCPKPVAVMVCCCGNWSIRIWRDLPRLSNLQVSRQLKMCPGRNRHCRTSSDIHSKRNHSGKGCCV